MLVSSLGQAPVDLDDVVLEHGYQGMRAYCQSKLAQIAFGFRLGGQLDPGEVTVTSLHPATFMSAKMVLAGGGPPSIRSNAASRQPPASPSIPSWKASPASFRPRAPGSPDTWAAEPEVQERLWQLSEQLTA